MSCWTLFGTVHVSSKSKANSQNNQLIYRTLSETNSSPVKRNIPREEKISSKHQFSGANLLVSGRVQPMGFCYQTVKALAVEIEGFDFSLIEGIRNSLEDDHAIT